MYKLIAADAARSLLHSGLDDHHILLQLHFVLTELSNLLLEKQVFIFLLVHNFLEISADSVQLVQQLASDVVAFFFVQVLELCQVRSKYLLSLPVFVQVFPDVLEQTLAVWYMLLYWHLARVCGLLDQGFGHLFLVFFQVFFHL